MSYLFQNDVNCDVLIVRFAPVALHLTVLLQGI